MSEENWIEVGSTDSIEEEDLIRFDHQDKTFCVYRLTDGFTLLMEFVHMRRYILKMVWLWMTKLNVQCTRNFNIKSGEALSPPACEDLKTYPVKVDNDKIFIKID